MPDGPPHTDPCCVRDLAAGEYHRDTSAVSSSTLKLILRSPAHCLAYQREGKVETAAMLNGRAVHAALLEPDVFDAEFAVVPKVDKRTKEGRAQLETFHGENAGKQLIEAGELDYIGRLQLALQRHPRARKLIELPGDAELSLFWTDPVTGLRLKARPDRLLRALPILVEAKTTCNAERSAFARKIVDLDYHLSLALYLEGVRQVLQRTVQPIFLVIEDHSFEVCLYQPDVEMLRIGHQRFRYAVETYARCAQANDWPGYQPDACIEEISLPTWAMRSAERFPAA
jgi:PDDEXK-like domain of unknown function (DUF3799)